MNIDQLEPADVVAPVIIDLLRKPILIDVCVILKE